MLGDSGCLLTQRADPVARSRRLFLPGLTLPALAAVTPPGWEIRFCFESVQNVPYDEPWDLVGITGMGSGIARAWRIADRFREEGVSVVMGGIGAGLAGIAATTGGNYPVWIARTQLGVSFLAALFLLVFGLVRLGIICEPGWMAMTSLEL